MKNLKGFDDFVNEGSNLYYNHWGREFTMDDFVSHFVDKLELFPKSMVEVWMDKYKLTGSSKVCWVSDDPKPRLGKGLSQDSYGGSNDVPENEVSDVCVDGEGGFIARDISDGAGGYLYVIEETEAG